MRLDSPLGLIKHGVLRTSPEVQWLRLHVPSAGGTGLIPDQGTKIPHAMQHGWGWGGGAETIKELY